MEFNGSPPPQMLRRYGARLLRRLSRFAGIQVPRQAANGNA